MQSVTIVSRSPDETGVVAVTLAPHLRAGDVALLSGGLAAGKTHFVKALVAALGSTDTVTSPTFSIANFYVCDAAAILHIDTYRLAGMAEFNDLALESYVETSITLIEWGDRIATAFPTHLSIAFDIRDDARVLTISAHGDRWRDVVAALGSLSGASPP